MKEKLYRIRPNGFFATKLGELREAIFEHLQPCSKPDSWCEYEAAWRCTNEDCDVRDVMIYVELYTRVTKKPLVARCPLCNGEMDFRCFLKVGRVLVLVEEDQS